MTKIKIYTSYIRFIYAQWTSRCVSRVLLYSLISRHLGHIIYCPKVQMMYGIVMVTTKSNNMAFQYIQYSGIDGFSRKILWLEVVKSNINPIGPAAFYLSAIKEHDLYPNLLQTNCGSENGDIDVIHCFLTGNNLSHRYSAAHANKPIENWGLHFPFFAWVIDYFKQLVPSEIFVPGQYTIRSNTALIFFAATQFFLVFQWRFK